MLAVISSMTPSPNMRIPATAVAQSRRYCVRISFACWTLEGGLGLL